MHTKTEFDQSKKGSKAKNSLNSKTKEQDSTFQEERVGNLINIEKIKDLSDYKNIIIDRICDQVKTKNKNSIRSTTKVELTKAFDISLQYCDEQSPVNLLEFFLSKFSDTLHVEDCYIRAAFVGDWSKTSEVDFSFVTDEKVEELSEKEQKVKEYLGNYLYDYNFSVKNVFDHPMFRNRTISCYPKELDKNKKVSLYKRFSEEYKLPEKDSWYVRPALDIEIYNNSACVRCYLTLPARAEPGSDYKDITQDKNNKILFKKVNLMNFGDPLRAFTWVEDYIVNGEHHNGMMIDADKPIIRSFLISIKEYRLLLDNGKHFLVVDADRAPGQVRAQGGYLDFETIAGSLVSFTDSQDLKDDDGKVIPLKLLGESLFGKASHPLDIAVKGIAHQHGRPIASSTDRYKAEFPDTVIQCRVIERDLAGFNLEPSVFLEKKEIAKFKDKDAIKKCMGKKNAKKKLVFAIHPVPSMNGVEVAQEQTYMSQNMYGIFSGMSNKNNSGNGLHQQVKNLSGMPV